MNEAHGGHQERRAKRAAPKSYRRRAAEEHAKKPKK